MKNPTYNSQIEEFAYLFTVQGLKQKEIAKQLGVTEQTIVNWKKKPEFDEHCRKFNRQKLREHGSDAITTLVNLMKNSDNDTVRLNAAKDILDRIGLKPVDEATITTKSASSPVLDLLKQLTPPAQTATTPPAQTATTPPAQRKRGRPAKN